ncbi:P-loop containing nucleoside triphosphate hydrolase protein [Daldinia caldariorum]|uniref:P-loop containing nucleoside triphosphate hydrolase protein n=1 Tax=Daldinia caldariorum TaxID=326644 RepID=UPI002008EA06|nr:P-loop containing nucleoside triphosphate hydrolase protein [Daldinia caldariorum]KAI1469642.1 P-loop containing nucleoside triphosphate hydrolase protein [Daldinia caldariorum]
MNAKPLWLLFSDIHFGSRDLDRVIRTANWIASLPQSHQRITRAVICGDLLTTRTSQPTHVLSACYRFLNKLVDAVPHVDIILGNHDLAYRLDYTTSALEALSINRLAPFVTIHTQIGCHEWDGRQVFVMPFREDQSQIVKAIHDLDPKNAAKTVGFGHLAINRAITQKYTINAETGKSSFSVRYPGLTGVGGFAPLARTFTGHFHSHQTILQTDKEDGNLQGSVTYIGAPLQLTWADLFDSEKGAILFDPETLQSDLVRNPHAVGYVSAEVQDILSGHVDEDHIRDKHVMITGKLSRYTYVSAKEILANLGARSVRDWKPHEPQWQPQEKGLGKTVLPADVQNLPKIERTNQQTEKEDIKPSDQGQPSASFLPTAPQIERKPIDLGEATGEYVSSLSLGPTLESKRDLLAAVGKRLVSIGSSARNKSSDTIKYQDILDLSTSIAVPSNESSRIFSAQPVSIEITNFLGVQGTLQLQFQRHFQLGMNFIVGKNGSGKSTIIEAIVWSQFGQCIREGLGVNDVVNDIVGKDCNVRLTFDNGYSISRFRKHSKYNNRVIVEKDGVVQPQFEGPSTRSSQASINELLGMDFDTFIRTILLGNESTRSFLSASPLQRRQLTEAALGLEVLDGCSDTCNLMMSQVDEELRKKESRLKEVTHTIQHLKGRVYQMVKTLKRLFTEAEGLIDRLGREDQKHYSDLRINESRVKELRVQLEREKLPDVEPELSNLRGNVSKARDEVGRLGELAKLAQARLAIDRKGAAIKQEIKTTVTQLEHSEDKIKRLLDENQILEVPPPPAKENYREARNLQELLQSISVTFRRVWTSVLKFLNVEDKFSIRARAVERRWLDHVGTIAAFNNTITEMQNHIAAIAGKVTDFSKDTSQKDIMSMTVQQASHVPTQLGGAIDELQHATNKYDQFQRQYEAQKKKRLQKEQNLDRQEKEIETAKQTWKVTLDRYHLMIAGKQKEIETYKGHLQSDAESLFDLVRQAAVLKEEAAEIYLHREIFAFWQSALTRRQVTKATFRRYVTERHLGELNKLLGQILLVMYQDANYARNMTSGTLGALFKENEEGDDHEANQESTSVLEPSLSINPALDYAKRSGGERKRVDLALFFALFMMAETRSSHMARYMLVDEAFDSLDVTGQASVLKWCRWMTERLSYVFVITHSPNLVKLAEDESSANGGVGANVVSVKAGSKGTELVEIPESITTITTFSI